jgi:hypothetical protein
MQAKIPIGWGADIEADDLYLQCTKVWCIRLTSLDKTRTLALKPFTMSKQEFKDKFFEWVNSFPDDHAVVFFNGLGYDLWALWKLYDIVPRVGKEGKDWLGDKPVRFIDPYVLAMFIRPDSPRHSLAYLASGSEDEKMDFRAKLIEKGLLQANAPKGAEFKFWSEEMAEYCDDDVKAMFGVFFELWQEAADLYGHDKWPHPSFRQVQKDYWLYSAQAYTGVPFHRQRAEALLETTRTAMEAIRKEVEPYLPPRPLKTAEQAFYRIPAKPFKKNGDYSTIMEKWLERHKAEVIDGNIHAYGLVVPLKAGEILPINLPMEIEDNAEIKQVFIDAGWEPHEDFWNFKRDPDTGKPMRGEDGKYIKTTPKIQHQGKICPNLLKIEGEIPKKLVKFLSYRNRQGIVQGWLNNERLKFDGRLSAEITGYAPTSRVKHKTVDVTSRL